MLSLRIKNHSQMITPSTHLQKTNDRKLQVGSEISVVHIPVPRYLNIRPLKFPHDTLAMTVFSASAPHYDW